MKTLIYWDLINLNLSLTASDSGAYLEQREI